MSSSDRHAIIINNTHQTNTKYDHQNFASALYLRIIRWWWYSRGSCVRRRHHDYLFTFWFVFHIGDAQYCLAWRATVRRYRRLAEYEWGKTQERENWEIIFFFLSIDGRPWRTEKKTRLSTFLVLQAYWEACLHMLFYAYSFLLAWCLFIPSTFFVSFHLCRIVFLFSFISFPCWDCIE